MEQKTLQLVPGNGKNEQHQTINTISYQLQHLKVFQIKSVISHPKAQ